MNDIIYRQDAIDALCAVCGNDCDKSEFVYNVPQDEQVILCPEHYCLSTLPSVQPEQKKGKWIKKKSMIYCPNCYNGFEAIFIRDYNFCPNCGADMRGD